MSFGQFFSGAQFYLIIFIWLIVVVWLESSKYFSKYRQFFSLLSAILFTLVIGLRWKTGTDWESYKELFDELKLNWDYMSNIYHFDTGYVILNAAVKFFTDNYSVFLLVDSFVAIGLLYILLYKSTSYPNISWLIFYANYMLIQFMGSNRRMIAMVLVLWCFYFFVKKEKLKSILSLIGAFFFHRSSFINGVMYCVSQRLFSMKKIVIILSVCFVAGVLQVPAAIIEWIASLLSFALHIPLVELLTYYTEYGDDLLVNGTGSLVLSTTFALGKRVIFLYFYWRLIKRAPDDKITIFFFNIYIIGIAAYLTLIGSFFQVITSYWAFCELILIGRVYKYSNRIEKLCFCMFIIAFGLFQLSNALNVFPELYIPYRSIYD